MGEKRKPGGWKKENGKRKYKKHQKVNGPMDGPILDEETGQILGDADDQDDSNYRVEVSYYKGKNGKTYGPYKTKVRRQTVRKWYIFEKYCQILTLLETNLDYVIAHDSLRIT